MPQYWKLSPATEGDFSISLDRVSHLLARIGQGRRDSAAEALLSLLVGHVALAQCAVFAFEAGRRPMVLAVGDRSRTRELPSIADAYVRRFHRLDPMRLKMQQQSAVDGKARAMLPAIFLHRQAPQDIANDAYRATCYELPMVAERLAVLAHVEGHRWLSVHLYRGIEHGTFSTADLRVLEQFAPLIVQAVRLHHAGQAFRHDLTEELLVGLTGRFPELTQRDADVLRSLVEGLDAAALSSRLGITVSSAQTYCKRLYRKLGVSGRRQLMALVLQGANTDVPKW